MTPSAVVFDCDGVLVDSEPHSVSAWLEVLGRVGHPASAADVAACTGLGFAPTHDALSALASLPSREETWPLLMAALARSFASGLAVFPDAMAVVEACRAAGVAVAVASASPRARLDLTLEEAGLGRRFTVSVAGDEVARPKPAPDVYLTAARRLGVDPTVCVAIEDTPAGVAAAVGAGMTVVAVLRVGGDRQRFEGSGARVVAALVPQDVGL